MEAINLNQVFWDSWLTAKGLSKGTIKQYDYYFGKFELDKLSQPYLIEYVNRYHTNVARAFLKNLLHFIKTNDFPKEIKLLIAELEIPQITGRKKFRLPQVLSEEQVFQLSSAMNTERNKIMTLITFYGGLRVAELCKIKPYDFNWELWLRAPNELGRLKVIGKGDKQRPVFVPSKLMARIYTWIKKEVSQKQGKDIYLFKIGERRWEKILEKASSISVGRHINPHLLRHSCGTWLRDNGWDLKEIAEYLGHENINTTAIYTHISQEKLKDKFQGLMPKEKKEDEPKEVKEDNPKI